MPTPPLNGAVATSTTHEADVDPTPLSDDDLETAMLDLHARIRNVEVQLGQPRKYDAQGREYTLTEFSEWRRAAKYAKEAMIARYRTLKVERRRRNVEANPHHLGEPGVAVALDAKLDELIRLTARIVELLEMD